MLFWSAIFPSYGLNAKNTKQRNRLVLTFSLYFENFSS